jgi:putative addiction module antidote
MNTVVRKIGNSEGVIIPKEMLERLGISAGDKLEIVETKDGLQLVRPDTDFAEQMRAAREGMKKYHDALRELAK